MKWNTLHFPAAMRSLGPSTRAKAIEIANELGHKGNLSKEEIIALSIRQARLWARHN